MPASSRSAMNGKAIIIALAGALVASIIAFPLISGSAGEQQYLDHKTDAPLRITASYWPTEYFILLADEKGFFEKNGVSVDLTFGDDYLVAKEKFQHKEYDISPLVFDDAVFQSSDGLDIKVIYVTDYSNSADAIVGSVTSLAELKGKKVGIEGVNSFSHRFVLNALKSANLTEADVEFVVMDIADVPQALDGGEIDAAHVYDPVIGIAVDKGYSILITAGQMPGTIADVLAVHADILEERSEDIQAVVKSIIEAKEYFDNNKDEALDMISERTGSTKEELEGGFGGLHAMSLSDNMEIMAAGDSNSSQIAQIGNEILAFYDERGQIQGSTDINSIIDPQIVINLSEAGGPK